MSALLAELFCWAAASVEPYISLQITFDLVHIVTSTKDIQKRIYAHLPSVSWSISEHHRSEDLKKGNQAFQIDSKRRWKMKEGVWKGGLYVSSLPKVRPHFLGSISPGKKSSALVWNIFTWVTDTLLPWNKLRTCSHKKTLLLPAAIDR